MQIHIAKLDRAFPINDFESWSAEAVRNAIVVGLGRILNDSVAGVALKDFDTREAFVQVCWKKITTRVDNLRNADVRQSSGMSIADLVAKAKSDPAVMAQLRALVAAESAPDAAVTELAETNAEALSDAA